MGSVMVFLDISQHVEFDFYIPGRLDMLLYVILPHVSVARLGNTQVKLVCEYLNL